ncbi:MAG TPA: hypothetical protein VGK30_05040 [Candidatus Binatia bacterium]
MSTTLFCGAAVYINVAEHPARMGCDTRIAATVWAPSYKRATLMQAPMAIHRPLEPGRDLASSETRALLQKWGHTSRRA